MEALCDYMEQHHLDGQELFQIRQENIKLQGEIIKANEEIAAAESRLPVQSQTEVEGIGKVQLCTEGSSKERRQTIQPLGKDASVPAFLRTDRPVPLRSMEEGEVVGLIKEVLRSKLVKDQDMRKGKVKGKANSQMSLRDYFYLFLKNQYGVQNVIVRVSYNLFYSMQNVKKSEIPDVEIFTLTLSKDLPESTFAQQQVMLQALVDLCNRVKQIEGVPREMERVSKASFLSILYLFLPKLNEEERETMKVAVELQSTDEVLPYAKLLYSGVEYTGVKNDQVSKNSTTQRTLCSLLKTHHLTHVKRAWYSFREILRLAAEHENGDLVTSDIVLDVLREVDPDMGDEDLQEHLSRALATTRKAVAHHFEAG